MSINRGINKQITEYPNKKYNSERERNELLTCTMGDSKNKYDERRQTKMNFTKGHETHTYYTLNKYSLLYLNYTSTKLLTTMD